MSHVDKNSTGSCQISHTYTDKTRNIVALAFLVISIFSNSSLKQIISWYIQLYYNWNSISHKISFLTILLSVITFFASHNSLGLFVIIPTQLTTKLKLENIPFEFVARSLILSIVSDITQGRLVISGMYGWHCWQVSQRRNLFNEQ